MEFFRRQLFDPEMPQFRENVFFNQKAIALGGRWFDLRAFFPQQGRKKLFRRQTTAAHHARRRYGGFL